MTRAGQSLQEKLEHNRNREIDKILLATIMLMTINFLVNLIRDSKLIRSFGSGTDLVMHLILRGGVVLTMLFLLYVLRNRLHYRWKYLITAVASVEVFLFYFSSFGILAGAKATIIFTPVLVAVGFSFRHAVAVLIFFAGSYLVMEWMFMAGSLEFLTTGNDGVREFVMNPVTWLTQGILYTGFTIGLINMGDGQQRSITDGMKALEDANRRLKEEEKELRTLRDNLEALVSEKTQALEETNRRLIQSNQTLRERNNAHQLIQSELQQILEEYREKQSTLLESGKMAAIGLLTAGMAHEINNPLNFINGAAHLLEQETGASVKRKEYSGSISRIRAAVDSTHKLVIGLNQFGRRTNSMDEQCDVVRISRNILSILDFGETGKGSVLVDCRFPEAPAIISGNSGNLHQAFLNLFQQAVQDMPAGQIFQIEVLDANQEIRLILSRETGPDAETSVGFNLRTSRKESLRMYIINRIIREHRGTLLVNIGSDNRKYWEVRFPAG